MHTYVAALCRPTTNSSMLFEFPESWGEFDLNTEADQVRATTLIIDATGAMWMPMTYAKCHSQAQIEEFRETIMEELNLPPCDVPPPWMNPDEDWT